MSFQSASSLQRSVGRDQRRRRLLTDECAHSGGLGNRSIGGGAGSPPKSEHYGDALFLEEQRRLSDLIPHRMVFLGLWLVVVAAMVAGLMAAYAWMLERVALGGNAIAVLDLGQKGSLGCWLSSLMLLAAGIAAALIHGVRRHRIDDYQGRYRIWIWAAACWLLLATDQAASLREGFRDMMIALTGTPLIDNGDLWWAMLYALGFGIIGSRLLVDMREDRTAAGVFIGAAAAHSLAVAVRLGWMLPPIGDNEILFLSGAEMAGNLMLLAAMTLHARYVLLDAEGLLPQRASDGDEADEDSRCIVRHGWRNDPSHTTPQPAHQQTIAPQPVAVSVPPVAVAPPVQRKLTKAEKKALRERLLRERLERERRGG